MAQPETIVSLIRSEVNQIINDIENAQSRAASLFQMHQKLGGATFFESYNWAESDITEQDFADAMYALQTAFPDLLGGNGVTLYKLKW